METSELRSLIEVERTEYLWTHEYRVTPRLVSHVFGDGGMLLWLELLNLRPGYFVLRVDTASDVDADEFRDLVNGELLDELLDEYSYEICHAVHDDHECEHSCWESAGAIASDGCAWGRYALPETKE